jgi:hypothetical protein
MFTYSIQFKIFILFETIRVYILSHEWLTIHVDGISIGEFVYRSLIYTTIIIILLFGLWGYWHCGHSWPIVPASGDSEDDYGEADGK